MFPSFGAEMLVAVVWFVFTDYLGPVVVPVLVYPMLRGTMGKADPIRFCRHVSSHHA
jgi:hypothetical protein